MDTFAFNSQWILNNCLPSEFAPGLEELFFALVLEHFNQPEQRGPAGRSAFCSVFKGRQVSDAAAASLKVTKCPPVCRRSPWA